MEIDITNRVKPRFVFQETSNLSGGDEFHKYLGFAPEHKIENILLREKDSK